MDHQSSSTTILADHYAALGVKRSATLDELKAAYRKVALSNHPDKTQHLGKDERIAREKTFKDANNAWETLGDQLKRRAYDRELEAQSNVYFNTSQPYRGSPASSTKSTRRKWEDAWQSTPFDFTSGQKPKSAYTRASDHQNKSYGYEQRQGESGEFRGNESFNSWFNPKTTETQAYTTVYCHDSTGWDFDLSISKKWSVIGKPSFTTPRESLLSHVTTFELKRNEGFAGINKDVYMQTRLTPGSRDATLAALYLEPKPGTSSVILEVTLSTITRPFRPGHTFQEWKFGFDVDPSSFVPAASKIMASHLTFHQDYPARAMERGLGLEDGKYFGASPMFHLAVLYKNMKFINLMDKYCVMAAFEGKKFWQLAAMGYEL